MSGPSAPPRDRATSTRCRRCGTLPEGAVAESCRRCGSSAVAARAPRARPPGPLAGLEGAVRGAAFVGNNPRLWTWIIIPLLINAATCGAFILLGYQLAEPWLPDLAAQDWGWFDGVRVVLLPVLQALIWMVAVVAALVVTLMVAGVINAPFYDLLSEKVENVALGVPDPGRPWSKIIEDSIFALRAALLIALRQAIVMLFLFVLSFTAIGAPLFVLAGFYYTGFALLDVTLARKRYDGRARIAWCRRHWALSIGLGLPVNIIPPLQPFGIVGATLLYLESPEKR
jgi:uncharacterized protein involved in cysteine biosynthesis